MRKGWWCLGALAGASLLAACREPSPSAVGSGYGVGVPRAAFTWGDDPERGENRHLPVNNLPDAGAPAPDGGAPDGAR